MKIIIGVSFRQAGKVYFFDPGDEQIERGEHVIVETAKGVEYGTGCCAKPRDGRRENCGTAEKDYSCGNAER